MSIKYSKSSWALFSLTRFFLAFVVLVSHLQWFAEATPLSSLFYSLGGKAAVIGFLLISGISVGYSFTKQPNGYFERRFLRIYPLYFFGVLFADVLMFLLPSPYKIPNLTLVASGWKTAVSNFFFTQGFLSIATPYNGPLWSVSVEVFFYILVPLLTRLRTEIIVTLISLSMLLFLFPQDTPVRSIWICCCSLCVALADWFPAFCKATRENRFYFMCNWDFYCFIQ